jgi:CRP-like cAMP-binding protein
MGRQESEERGERIEQARGSEISTELFRRFDLFRGLTDEELDRVAGFVTYCVYDTGETVIEEEERSRGLYILLEGEVEVVKSADGDEWHLATLERDAMFGELGLVLGEPRGATVRATERADLLRMDGEQFEGLRSEQSLAAYKIEHNILKKVAHRQATMNRQLMSLMKDAEDTEGTDDITQLRESLSQEWSF